MHPQFVSTKNYPTGDYDAGNHRDEGGISDPSLPFEGHQVGKDGSEEGRSGTDRLIERDRKVSQGYIAAYDGGAEDKAESGDLEELRARPNGLERY